MAKADFRTILADMEAGRKPDTSSGIRTTDPRRYRINRISGIIHVGRTENRNSVSPQDEVVLLELQKLQKHLESTEPLISRIVGELRDAIRENNQPKISTTIRDLTTGSIGTVIAGLASTNLKKFLGLP